MTDFEKHIESYQDVGPIYGYVRNFEMVEKAPKAISSWKKFKFLMKVERHMFARLFGKAKLQFRNLPSGDLGTSATGSNV